MIKKVLMVAGIGAAGVFGALFTIYYFNLDMKLIVNHIAPFLEKQYDKRERKQYV